MQDARLSGDKETKEVTKHSKGPNSVSPEAVAERSLIQGSGGFTEHNSHTAHA